MPEPDDEFIRALRRLWRGEQTPQHPEDEPVDDTPEQTEPGWA